MYSIYFYSIYRLRSRKLNLRLKKVYCPRVTIVIMLMVVRVLFVTTTIDTIVDPVDLAAFEIIPYCLSHSILVFISLYVLYIGGRPKNSS